MYLNIGIQYKNLNFLLLILQYKKEKSENRVEQYTTFYMDELIRVNIELEYPEYYHSKLYILGASGKTFISKQTTTRLNINGFAMKFQNRNWPNGVKGFYCCTSTQ